MRAGSVIVGGARMDWKSFADHFDPMTCVLSVEKRSDGRCGTVRIVTGNRKYIDSIALAAGDVELDSTKKVPFIPDSEYTRYIPKDLNFEEVCYRCAIQKQPIHNCIHAPRYPFDILAYLMPLESDDERFGYCTYTQVLIPKNDNNLISLNISQETAMDIIGTCIKLRDDKPFSEIMREVIEDIRNICGAEYCCVLLLDENQRRCSVLAEAKASGSALGWMEDYLDDDFYSLAETWQDTLSGAFCLVVSNEHDMSFIREKNPEWHRSLTSAGVEKLVLFPLMSRGHLMGYIYAVNYPEENARHIKDTLELTTYFIASEIANNRFIEQLKEISKMDLLTGVMNRNAMNTRITELSETPGEASGRMGFVFADMNGLKYINDHQGHHAGDLLLKNAAMVLQNTFTGDEIYRAGGDEFFILLSETNEADLRTKISEIKKKSELFENISFAVGYCLLRPGMDPRTALSEADAYMYEDKENCYRENPGLKRDP
jgi:diguanylate cyclase (GGDEF)-like protein